jgi:hypothetical protein
MLQPCIKLEMVLLYQQEKILSKMVSDFDNGITDVL